MKQMTDISKILFIGTIPTINISEPVYADIKSGWNTSPSYSVFGLVERFLANYHGEYWFVNYGTVGTHGIQVNHDYDQHTYTIDLRKPLTPEAIDTLKNADLIYIDSNTLGFIDYRIPADGWIDMFYPLLSDKGCFVIDDDMDDKDHFPIRKSPAPFFDGYLGKRVYRGLTERFIPAFERFPCQLKGVLHDFIQIAKRRYPTILFRIEGVPDGKINPDDPNIEDIAITKFNWNLIPYEDDEECEPSNGMLRHFIKSLYV